MKKCLRCGGVAEIQTEKGFLCSGCDSLRLSYLNNPYEEKDINDFWKEIKNNSIERGYFRLNGKDKNKSFLL